MTAIKVEGFPAIDDALAHVKSEEATASVAADLTAIKALIESYQGGYDALNEAVKVRLRSWFQNIAGIIDEHSFWKLIQGQQIRYKRYLQCFGTTIAVALLRLHSTQYIRLGSS